MKFNWFQKEKQENEDIPLEPIVVSNMLNILYNLNRMDLREREKFLQDFYQRLELLDKVYKGRIVPSFEEVDLTFLYEEIIAEIASPETEFLETETEIMDPLVLQTDREYLRTVLRELLRNAIFACQGQGRIVISMGKSSSGEPTIEIKDSGIGIQKNEMPKIFYPFYRGNERFSKGAGLGLPLVQGLLRYLGAKMEIQSKFREGTTCRLYFPLSNKR